MKSKNTLKALALMALAAASIGAQANTLSLTAGDPGTNWVAITPAGSVPIPCCSAHPIAAAGVAFEAANVGWNSSASYNAAAWSPYAGGLPSQASPFYAREVFNIGGTPTHGEFYLHVDDDSQLWVNGTMVYDDHNLQNYNPYTDLTDITAFLQSGDNVIAFKAHNSNGGGFSADQRGFVNFDAATDVPEPGSLALLGLGLLAAGAVRKASRKNAVA